MLGMGKWLANHPEALIPKCENECRMCNFDKIKRGISRAAESKDNPIILKKLAKRGDHLARAYAAALLQANTEKAPFLVVAKGPDGKIAYMHSAKVKREALIGVQYFKDPHLRLLAYSDISRKRKLAFYSVGDSIYCAPDNSPPPDAFIQDIAKRLSLSKRDKTNLTCSHYSPERGYLQIDWENAGISIMICEECLGERNSLLEITRRMISPSIRKSFSFHALIRLDCDRKCADCPSGKAYESNSDDSNAYLTGKYNDEQLYSKATDDFLNSVKDSGSKIITVGRRCFGDDKDALVEAVATNNAEKEALAALAKRISLPIILSEGTTANKLLSNYWGEYGEEILKEIAGTDAKYKESDLGETNPMSIIEKAKASSRSKSIIGALPEYKSLGKYSMFIDSIAREFKVSGKDAAQRLAAPSGTEETRQKSIGLAFRIALGETGMEWQYNKEEVDFARHLSGKAKTLLGSDGDEYDAALKDFLINAGIEEKAIRSR